MTRLRSKIISTLVGMGFASAVIPSLGAQPAAPAPVPARPAWTFVDNDHDHVQYTAGDRQIFTLGCSKFVGFSAIYPDQSRKRGQAKIQLSNGKTTLNFVGDLEEDDKGTVSVNVILDKVSAKPTNQVLALLSAGLLIKISAGKNSYVLQVPTIDNLKNHFNAACNISE